MPAGRTDMPGPPTLDGPKTKGVPGVRSTIAPTASLPRIHFEILAAARTKSPAAILRNPDGSTQAMAQHRASPPPASSLGRSVNGWNAEYLDDLIENGPPNVTQKRISRVTLWDNWWFLIGFVALLSTEWFVRKKRGLV